MRSLRYEYLVLLLGCLWLGRTGGISLRGAYALGVLGFYALLLFGLAVNVGYVSGRHTLPPVMTTFGYVAVGLLALAAWLAEKARPVFRSQLVATAVLLLVVASIGFGKSLTPDRLDGLAERRAAEWLRDQRADPRGVAARKRRTAWYARAPHVKLHREAGNLGRVWHHGASHLILSDEADEYPDLRPQLEQGALLLHRAQAAGSTASVYELLPPRTW